MVISDSTIRNIYVPSRPGHLKQTRKTPQGLDRLDLLLGKMQAGAREAGFDSWSRNISDLESRHVLLTWPCGTGLCLASMLVRRRRRSCEKDPFKRPDCIEDCFVIEC